MRVGPLFPGYINIIQTGQITLFHAFSWVLGIYIVLRNDKKRESRKVLKKNEKKKKKNLTTYRRFTMSVLRFFSSF